MQHSEFIQQTLSATLADNPKLNPLRVEFVEETIDGVAKSTPPIYLAQYPKAEDYEASEKMVDAIWDEFEKKINNQSEVDDPLELTNDGENAIVKIYIDEDDGEPTIRTEDKPLGLVRHGLQVIRVYGWGNIKVQCLSHGLTEKEFMEAYGYTEEEVKELMPWLFGEGFNESLRKDDDDEESQAPSVMYYSYEFELYGKTFKKVFAYPSDRGLYSGKQVKYRGRRNETISENLQFNGVKEQTISNSDYVHEKAKIRLRNWSRFHNVKGEIIERPRQESEVKSEPEKRYAQLAVAVKKCNINAYLSGEENKDRVIGGKQFVSPVECIGDLFVEYPLEFSEFIFLYDYAQVKRSFEVVPGTVEKVGSTTWKNGILAYSSDSIRGIDIPNTNARYYKINEEGEFLSPAEEVQEDDCTQASDDCKKIKVKIFNKLSFLPVKPLPIKLHVTNDDRGTHVVFNPPAPIFSTPPPEDTPKVLAYARYERRLMSTDPGDEENYIDTITEANYVDPFGNISTEKFDNEEL